MKNKPTAAFAKYEAALRNSDAKFNAAFAAAKEAKDKSDRASYVEYVAFCALEAGADEAADAAYDAAARVGADYETAVYCATVARNQFLGKVSA